MPLHTQECTFFTVLARQSISKTCCAVTRSFGDWQNVLIGPKEGLVGGGVLGFAGSETGTEWVVPGNWAVLWLCTITNTEWTSGERKLASERGHRGGRRGQLKRMLGLEIMLATHQLGDNADDRTRGWVGM